MKKILCFFIGHTFVSMKDVPNARYHDCEWCKRCFKIKDKSKYKAGINTKMSDNKKLKYAKDCKCCKCGKQAVCFWPMVDPDIRHYPYCRKCVEVAKMKLQMKMAKEDLI